MATTTLIPLHAGKRRAVAEALGRSTDYVKNPGKTDGGEWVSAYECDPVSVDSEFRFSKAQYAATTGRDQGERDVIAYHLRQSFKPGEVDPATANKIGYELAMSLTREQHAFICCTHVDKEHIHSHIIFNSTSLDYSKKFRNFKGSSFAIRKISDRLCLENGLSVIEKPKPRRSHYGTWLGDNKPKSQRDKLRDAIDTSASVGITFDEFLDKMKATGAEVKRGKHLAFRISGGEKFIRCKSLGDDYTEEAILERLLGKRVIVAPTSKPRLLIDIQTKLQQGYGAGFEHFAKLQNLKVMAKTLIYLQEHGLDDYAVLEEKSASAASRFNDLNDKIKAADNRMSDIAALQKHIGNYSRTRDVYVQYRKSGYSKKFYDTHAADIILHQAAKKHFDSIGLKKLPSMQSLRQEYAILATEKKKLYQEYRQAKDEMRELITAKSNVDRLLNIPTAAHDPRKTPNRVCDNFENSAAIGGGQQTPTAANGLGACARPAGSGAAATASNRARYIPAPCSPSTERYRKP